VAEAGVGPGLDQQAHDLRAVGEVTRPVSDQVQRSPEAFAVCDPGPGQLGVLRQQPPDRLDIAAVNGDGKLDGPRVIRRDFHAGRLIAHGHNHRSNPGRRQNAPVNREAHTRQGRIAGQTIGHLL
jgi:hypothetical protein